MGLTVKTDSLIAGGVCLFGLIVVSLTWIHLCFKFRKQTKKISSIYQKLVYIFFISVVLCLISAIIHYVSCYVYGYELLGSELIVTVPTYLTDSFYFISSLLIYILILSKVYFTFKGTMYALSKCVIYLISLTILIIAVLMITFILLFIIIWTKADSIGSMISIALMVLDIILNIMMLTIFISKLKQLYQSTINYENASILVDNISVRGAHTDSTDIRYDSTRNISFTSQNNTENTEYNINVSPTISKTKKSSYYDPCILKRKNNLLNLMTKQLILGIIASIVNQCYNLSNAILFLIPPKTNMDAQRNEAIFSICMTFEHIMNSFVMYWTFKMNNDIYLKFCGFFHRIIMNCFE